MKMGDKFKAQIMLYFNIKLLKYSDTYANRNYVKGKSNIFKNWLYNKCWGKQKRAY